MNFLFVFIYIYLIIVSVFLTKIKYKRYLLPNTIFTFLWSLIGILSITIEIGLLNPSFFIHFHVIIMILTFNTVYFSVIKKEYIKSIGDENIVKTYRIDQKSVYIANFIALILFSPNLIQAIKVLSMIGFDFAELRTQVFVNMYDIYGSYILMFLFRTIPIAIFSTIMLISAYFLSLGKKKYITLTIINLIIVTICYGGRSLFVNFIIYLIGSLVLNSSWKKIKFKEKKYIIYIIVAIVITTLFRGNDLIDIAKMAHLYYVGSLSYLELTLQNPIKFGLSPGYMFGYMTFGFIFEPLVLMLKFFTGANIDVPTYHFNIYVQDFVNIGDTQSFFYNNNVTMLYTFFKDFGLAGSLVGSFIIAWLVTFFQKKGMRTGNLIFKLLYVYMFAVIVDGLRVYTLSSTTLLLIFITLLLVVKKN